MQLRPSGTPRLSWDYKAPPSETIQRPPRSADWGLWPRVLRPGPRILRRNKVAGSRPQGPVGQVSRGLGARAPRAWGPARQGPGAFSPHQTSQITIFRKPPGGSLAKAWVSAETAASEVGTWRETKPGYPPYPPPPPSPCFGAVREKGRGFSPSPPSATIQHAPQGRQIEE